MGLFSFASFLVTTSLGTLYPIYLSYKALKTNNLQSLEILLMFWIVMGIIHAIESTFGWFLHWIPFFHQFKSIFMLWLTLPQIQGSTYLYVEYIHPFLVEHEVEIDTWLIEMKEKCRDAGTCYFYQFIDKLKEMLLTTINMPENDQRRSNGVGPIQPESARERQLDAASTYAINWIRQLGPTATAILQPMQNRMQDTFSLQPPNYVPSSNPSTGLFATSHQSDLSFRTLPDGYQIPDYDEVPIVSNQHHNTSGNTSTSSRRPPSSHHNNPSSDSVPIGQLNTSHRSSSSNNNNNNNNNLNLSGYDEIGRDEASGSENESLLLRKSIPRQDSSSSIFSNQRSTRMSDGNNQLSTPKLIDPSSKRSVSSSASRWFSWSSPKNTLTVSDSKKQN